MTKRCSKCKETKDVSEFNKDKARRGGLQHQCRQCEKSYREVNREKISARRKAYRENNREKIAAALKDDYERNKEIRRSKQKDYYKKNREKIIARSSAYYKDNYDRSKEYRRLYYKSNKNTIRANVKAYRESNREKIQAKKNVYKKRRRKTDLSYRFTETIRTATWRTFKGTSKPASTFELLGCTLEFAMAHLESQFTEGMSWDNCGKGSVPKGQPYWEIDHIFPLAKADSKDPAQARAVSNWRNLQPLWWQENRSKGDKVFPAARKLFRELCREFESQERKVG